MLGSFTCAASWGAAPGRSSAAQPLGAVRFGLVLGDRVQGHQPGSARALPWERTATSVPEVKLSGADAGSESDETVLVTQEWFDTANRYRTWPMWPQTNQGLARSCGTPTEYTFIAHCVPLCPGNATKYGLKAAA
jgi:hypothetical protein